MGLVFSRLLDFSKRLQLTPAILGLFALGATLILVFGHITEEVLEGDATAFDDHVIGWFRDDANPNHLAGPGWLQNGMRDLTALGSVSVLVMILLLTTGFLLSVRRFGAALFLFVSVAGGEILSSIAKAVVDRPRPVALADSPAVYSASFPSGHAMLSAVTYLTLGALATRMTASYALRAYFLLSAALVTILVGISRVYLGVHWPSDVLAGWTLGAAWAILCWAIALRFQNRVSANLV